jgi:hypothetical protein
MIENEILMVIAGGCVGALLKEILVDNCLQLPSIVKGKLDLGFLGSIIIGAFVGYAIDGNFITACFSGYTGFSIIENLFSKNNTLNAPAQADAESLIRLIAKQEVVDPDLAVRVAKCESNLKADAVNVNKDGSRDRGIYQINDKYHPEVTDAQAFDITYSTKFFCTAFKAGNISWWNASKSCWDK